jgi:uncharacterized phage protein gp47/JayE
MKINKNGFTLSTLNENLQVWVNRLKSVFGNDFVIKKEGAVDNIATSSSLSIMDLENQVAFLIKQMNPNTAEGEWQDKLYSLIGLKRRQATYTVVSRTVVGEPNTEVLIGELMFENASTKDQFRNNDIIQIGADGTGLGSFTAEESGAIDLPIDATLKIITPLENVTGVYHTPSNLILIGEDYENDADFRERWKLTSSQASANTTDGLYKALLDLVETKSDLKIFENRTGEEVNEIPAHSQRIVLNSAYDDETIASVIMQHLVDGNMFGLQGEISVELQDSEGSTEIIKFDRAEILSVFLRVKVTITENTPLATAQQMIKDNVLKYISENKFDMGSKIWANMFASSIYQVDSVSEITELKISTNGADWGDFIQLNEVQVPSFDSTRIQVYEEE